MFNVSAHFTYVPAKSTKYEKNPSLVDYTMKHTKNLLIEQNFL